LRNKRFIPLNLKLSLIVVLSLVVTLIVYIAGVWLTQVLVDKYYNKEEVIEKEVNTVYDDFIEYINHNSVKGTNSEAIQNWAKKNEYTYLKVYDNNSVYFDGGWIYDSTGVPEGDSSVNSRGMNDVYISEYNSERISYDTFNVDFRNRIVTFADDDYYVYIDVYKQAHFYRIMFILRTAICVSVFIAILLIYNTKVTNRMVKLSREVREVSGGDLDAEITPLSNDEIGQVAVNVDTMRNSIIERLQKEKEAWEANTQLITAMSHDIRTPLTSLIGYLDIIESGKAASREEELKYISICHEKAFQLKDLSDKLFQYFLVFGSQDEMNKKFEVFDADILLQQLLSEHSAELINHGFKIEYQYSIEDVKIRADISALQRLFDNVMSNVMKYADMDYHISIIADADDKWITVKIINGILAESRKVESNKIGLKTCEKICADMGGSFKYSDENQIFSVRITLPVYNEPEQPEKTVRDEEKTKEDSQKAAQKASQKAGDENESESAADAPGGSSSDTKQSAEQSTESGPEAK
jgi:signal transduction histidine kinase